MLSPSLLNIRLVTGAISKPVQFAGPINGTDPHIRLMGSIRSVSDVNKFSKSGALETQYLRWNPDETAFELVYERGIAQGREGNYPPHYRTDFPLVHAVQMAHGEVVPGDLCPGAIVDQQNKRIVLPDGRWIDGPTGDHYNPYGYLLLSKDGSKEPKAKMVGRY